MEAMAAVQVMKNKIAQVSVIFTSHEQQQLIDKNSPHSRDQDAVT